MRRYSAVLSSCRRSAPPSVMRPLVVEEAQQQPRQRGFSRARRADDCRDRAGREREAEVRQGLMLRAVGVADVLEADFLAVGQSLLAGRGDVQRGRLQQRLHALGRAGRAAQVMQQCVQQQHRRADARRDQREGQHVQRRHPAQMRVQQAERQHQAQHRHRRDHRVGMGHGAHQRAREGGEGAGEAVDRLAIAAMRAASVAEGLDHGYAVDELDRGAVDAAEPFHEFLHVRAAGLHGAAQEQEEARKRQQRDDGQAPVHGEQVGRRRHDGARRASHGGVEVRGQAVQRGDVVLQHLLDLARGALREPAQRHLGAAARRK